MKCNCFWINGPLLLYNDIQFINAFFLLDLQLIYAFPSRINKEHRRPLLCAWPEKKER